MKQVLLVFLSMVLLVFTGCNEDSNKEEISVDNAKIINFLTFESDKLMVPLVGGADHEALYVFEDENASYAVQVFNTRSGYGDFVWGLNYVIEDSSVYETLYNAEIDFTKSNVLFYTKSSFMGELNKDIETIIYPTQKEAKIEFLKLNYQEENVSETRGVEVKVYIVPKEIEYVEIIQGEKHIKVPMRDPNEKICNAFDVLNNSMTKEGVKLELEVQRCQEEGHPVKIKAVVKNENDYPVMYVMGNIGDPAIYTKVSNPYFYVTTPSNPNDPDIILPATDYQVISSQESIVRETTWDNKLVSGVTAPNGDYNISATFHYVGNADLIDLNSSRDSESFITSTLIKKEYSENFLTAEDALDRALDDAEVKAWLDDNDGTICEKVDKQTMAKYTQEGWEHGSYSDLLNIQNNQGKYCSIRLHEEQTYHLEIFDKSSVSIGKKIDVHNGVITALNLYIVKHMYDGLWKYVILNSMNFIFKSF